MGYYIASVSWGKDSLAMLLRLLAIGAPLDEVIFYDTGMEFQAIYDTRDRVLPRLRAAGIKYTELHPTDPFLWSMLERPVESKQKGKHMGYGWCGGTCRWGTTEKTKAMDAYAEKRGATVYVGIAADELPRLVKEKKEYKVHPLAEWGMTERDCKRYCYAMGVPLGGKRSGTIQGPATCFLLVLLQQKPAGVEKHLQVPAGLLGAAEKSAKSVRAAHERVLYRREAKGNF